MTEGIVYVLTNPALPGIVKIGKTTRVVSARLNELYSTGVPLPFKCAYAARVEDESKVERAFHQAFGPDRINSRREFFDIEPEQAIALLELMALEDMTTQLKQEADSVDVEAKASSERFERSRRPPLNFIEMGIPAGATLHFEDGETTCAVLDERRVIYEGENCYLSGLTKRLLDTERKIHPTRYWSYGDQSLSRLYVETYGER
jgi:hypothetical protein